MKIIIKKLIILCFRVLALAKAWLSVPIYARRHGFAAVYKQKRPIIAVPFKGVFNAQEEVERTFKLLVEVLHSAKIDFFVVPHQNRKLSVAVMTGKRSKTLKLVNMSGKFSGYYGRVIKSRHNTGVVDIIERGLSINDPSRVLAVEIFRNVSADNGRVLTGEAYKVTLEFWSKAEDLPEHLLRRSMDEAGILDEEAMRGSLVAPTPNGIVKVLAPEAQKRAKFRVGNSTYPTFQMFTEQLLTQVNFPIDIVYTWVDDSDELWQKRYQKAKLEDDPNHKNNTASRYTNHDELKYSLRSVEMFAPWVRNIYIVTDQQRPGWLKEGKNNKVKIVDHKDIFRNKAALPVFNSHAIESQLHHIQGLSEHYLYLNDDVFFGRPTVPETFFYPNGIAKIQLSSATIGSGNPSVHESAPSSAGKNARDVILKKFNVYVTNKIRHSIYPQIKAVAETITNENKAALDKTMWSKFRAHDNLPFTSTLMQSYLLASGHGVPETYPSITVNVSLTNSAHKIKELLRSQWPPVVVCLNESITTEEQLEKTAERIDRFLSASYPWPSSWEL